MASHRGHDERMRAACLQVVAHFPDEQGEVVDAATAGGDRDPGARPESTPSSAVSCDRSAPRGSSRRARSNRCRILKSWGRRIWPLKYRDQSCSVRSTSALGMEHGALAALFPQENLLIQRNRPVAVFKKGTTVHLLRVSNHRVRTSLRKLLFYRCYEP